MDTCRLLLVDNNTAFVRIARRFLESQPDFGPVASAESAAQGLSLASQPAAAAKPTRPARIP